MDTTEYRTIKVIGMGPSGRGLKTLNNKNNLEGLYLKKKVDHYTKKHTFTIARIDRDKFDTLDFLKHIYHTESDLHPAAIQYLGRDPSNLTRSGIRRHRTAPGESDPDSDIQLEPLSLPTRTPNYNQSRRSLLLPQPTQISRPDHQRQTSTAKPKSETKAGDLKLPSLDKTKSIYLQIAAVVNKTEDNTCASRNCSDYDSHDEHTPGKGRNTSFMAWVQDQRNETRDTFSLTQYHGVQRDPLEDRRNEFRQWLADRKYEKDRRERTYSFLLAHGNHELTRSSNATPSLPAVTRTFPSFRNVGKMMVQMKKKPIKDRMKDFCSKCDDLKLEDADTELTDEQLKRCWSVLTKGRARTHAECSNDDDDDDDDDDLL